MAFTFVDLFCGIGGFHHALSALGGKCVLASDIDAKCRANYALNFGLEPVGDIRNITDVPDHDILCAGFPCQPFSTGGHRAGFADEARGTLIYEVVRILEAKKPKGFILENVKGLLSIQDGHVMLTILHALDELGYWVNVKILSPDVFGVPQHRERVYFIGIRKDVGDTVEIPLPVKEVVAIRDPDPDPKYAINQDLIDAINAWNETLPVLRSFNYHNSVYLEYFTIEDDPTFPDWKKAYIRNNKALYAWHPNFWNDWMNRHEDLLAKRKLYTKLEWQAGVYTENCSIWDNFIQLRQSGIRVKKADRFPTLVAMVQTPIYGPERRFLTPRECARLQSFPESHILADKDMVAYKQLGNSVNVNVVSHVARALVHAIIAS
jgi:DNA (cytosine-5)-methyltransferase 1